MTEHPVTERRPYETTIEIRDIQAVGRPYRYLEGRAVPYETWGDVGWFLELHRAGSFRQSCKVGSGRQLPLCLFHDRKRLPIGHAEKWDHADDGLYGVWRLNDTRDAQEAATLAEGGDLTGMSVGFAPIKTDLVKVDDRDWNPDLGPEHMDRVVRLESRLLEVSLTPTPVFSSAEVMQVRSAHPRPVLDVDRWRTMVDGLRSA